VVDGGEPGVDSRDEGKHTGRNDLLFVEKMSPPLYASYNINCQVAFYRLNIEP